MNVKVLSNQSILDICLLSTGTVESMFDILKLNNLKSLSIKEINSLEVINPVKNKVVSYYITNSISPATEINKENISFGINLMFTNNQEILNTTNNNLIIA
jgi:hypothetical protein